MLFLSFEEKLACTGLNAYVPYAVRNDTILMGISARQFARIDQDQLHPQFIIKQLLENTLILQTFMPGAKPIVLYRVRPVNSRTFSQIRLHYATYGSLDGAPGQTQFIDLYPDALLQIDGRNHENLLGFYSGTVAAERMQELREIMQSFSLDSLKSSYPETSSHPNFYTLQIRTSEGLYQVSGFGGSGEPPGLLLLINKLRHLYGHTLITHDTSVMRKTDRDWFYANRIAWGSRLGLTTWQRKLTKHIKNGSAITSGLQEYTFVFTEMRKVLAIHPDSTYSSQYAYEVAKNKEGKAEEHYTISFSSANVLTTLNGTYRLAPAPRNSHVFVGLEPNQRDTLVFEIMPKMFEGKY